MSQEERSELSTEPVSDLSGEETEAAEVNSEDSDKYAWDNYREDPSFVEKDPEEEDLTLEREVTVPRTGRRASSTDHQFLEDPVPPVIKPFIFSYQDQNINTQYGPQETHLQKVILLLKKICCQEDSLTALTRRWKKHFSTPILK